MRIAVLADIHGNLRALDAVLADVAGQHVDLTVNLGDVVSGALQPRGTAERLGPLGFPTVRGNHERQLLTTPPERMGPSDRHAHETITAGARAWLASLPGTLGLPGSVLLVHGTPHSDLASLLDTVEKTGARAATVGEVEARLGLTPATLVLCGHTHLPRSAALPGGRLVVNPGSVGLPAYADDVPFAHRMEAGTPHARYAVVDDASGSWHVEHRRVVYDWDAAAREAQANGRPDVAYALCTGRAGLGEP